GMRITRDTDDSGNTTMTITGHAVHIDWTTGDLFGSCVAGADCGGPDTMADPVGTGYRFMGNTQDLEVWGQDAIDTYDGMYLASDAQARPNMVNFGTFPEPYWSLQVLGNPHLDVDGNPVRGSFNAWLPPAYFAKLGTSASAAALVGFDVVSREGETSTSVPATVSVQDAGVGIDVPDLGYSMHQIDVYSRPSPVVAGVTVPDPPNGVEATAADVEGAVDVDWAAPDSDGGSAVTGYTVRAFTAPTGGTIAGRCTAATTSCTITGLTDDTTYYLAASASNAFGEGRPTAERASATAVAPVVTAPSVPRAVALTAGAGALRATWQAPESTGGSPVTGYSVAAYLSAEGGEPAQTCAAAAPALACYLTDLINGTPYFVTVTATNAADLDGPASSPVSGTPRTVPSPARSVAVVGGNASLGVTWTEPTSTGGSPVTGYTARAYTAPTGGSPVKACTAPAEARACSVTGLANGTTYYVAVTATNVVGAASASARVASAPRTTPSATPGVALTAGDGALGVTWNVPGSTGGSPITGYSVAAYRTASGGSPVKTCTAVAPARVCYLTGLTNGTVYYVVVTAANAAGPSREAAVRVAAVPRTRPTVVRSVTAAAISGKIRVNWAEPAFNGGSVLTAYRVAVYTSPDSSTPVAQCAVVASVHTCTTLALTTGRTYYVTVTATNAAGQSVASTPVAVLVRR
ncbi:MAG: hypothetical protein QOE03_1030, partial [Micromonosporaceae bacterium]|nr:hypothetical protein [Micromonosporaceae bacterium]